MWLFGKKNTVMVVGGIIFLHLIVGVLCGFFIYKFLFITYDASVFLLLILLIGPVILCDIMAAKLQAFSRFLVQCKTNSEGIYCAYVGRKWCIRWSDIHVFGVTGFSSVSKTGIVFLSCDFNEKYQDEELTKISRKRIAFSAEKDIWEEFCTYMPGNIRIKLEKAIRDNCDCYYRYH